VFLAPHADLIPPNPDDVQVLTLPPDREASAPQQGSHSSTMGVVAPSPADASEPLLSLCGFGIAYGERRILEAIELDIPTRRIIVMMGPAGTGKSTLLRTLCCERVPAGSVQLFGEAKFRGRRIDAENCPVLVAQQLHLLSNVHDYLAGGLANRSEFRRTEQRQRFKAALHRANLPHLVPALDLRLVDLTPLDRKCLGLIRALGSDPALICVDELTAGLDDASPLLSIIREERSRRAFLVVTHHQGHARAIADDVVLLAGGRVVEQSPSGFFFASPRTQAAAHFLKTGGCDLPSPNARPEHLAPECRSQPELPAPIRTRRTESDGPPGFQWLIEGRLGGVRQPGIFGNFEQDLEALHRIGATVLVSLTEQPLRAVDMIERLGLRHHWFPIDDMGVPDLGAAASICAAMEREIEMGAAVVYHCLAGHGRTGLMLVAHLICRGMTASQALAYARRRKREWVQSLCQEQFLWNLELYLAMHNGQSDV
jgi:atypical dual specificity phosphatase